MEHSDFEDEATAKTPAFQKVYEALADLDEVLETGGEADEDAATSLASIKATAQMVLDAANNLSLEDFEQEYAEDASDTEDASEAETLDRIFS